MDRGQEAYIFRNKMAAKETLSAHTIVLQNPRPFLIFLVQRLEKLKDDPGKEVGKLQPNYSWWINRSATTQRRLRLTGCPHRFWSQEGRPVFTQHCNMLWTSNTTLCHLDITIRPAKEHMLLLLDKNVLEDFVHL